MTTKCKKCGIEIDDDEPQQNGMCIDCFTADWGELIEISPIAIPRTRLYNIEKKEEN